jgi:hypothetical protein
MSTLGEDFPREQERVRELLAEYLALGPVGAFGAHFIKQALKQADEAAISGDVARIIAAYQELKDCQ